MAWELFFGGRERAADARAEVATLRARLGNAREASAGPVRHSALASCLVLAGELAQGIADEEEERAPAAPGEAIRASLDAVSAVGRALWRSWRAGGESPVPAIPEVAALARAPLPDAIRIRGGEGYAFYALYPETYAAAAEPLAGGRLVAVGLRSIGTGLAAMVAAGAGAQGVAATFRPRGDPFRRSVALPPSQADALLRAGDAVAIADEGPGLSGSSFAAAVEALTSAGAPLSRIHLFPSHRGGPGAEADARIRALLAAVASHHVPFEALLLGPHPLALEHLAQDVTGPCEAPLSDLSAGAWRCLAWSAKPEEQPPSQGWRERRKYLLRAGGRSWLARFAGIGAAGERILSRAQALGAARLSIAPAALRHGFLFEPWRADATPLPLARVARSAVVEAVRRHVSFVAARFPASRADGASPRTLLHLIRVHAERALGPGPPAAGPWLDALAAEAEAAQAPAAIDGKLQPWEWLVLPGGELRKADALDHHADHALAGCQDALWDVAGAELELGLWPAEVDELIRTVRGAAPGAPPRCLPFYRAAYSAFELGRWSMAERDPGLDPDERARRASAAALYREALRRALAAGTAGARSDPRRAPVTAAATVWQPPPAPAARNRS